MLGCYFLYQKTASMHVANENILLYFLSKKQIVFCFDQDGPRHSLWPLMACVFVTWDGDSDGLRRNFAAGILVICLRAGKKPPGIVI